MKTLIFLILSFWASTGLPQWEKLSNSINNADILSIKVKGNTIFAGTDGGGVYKSTNEGLNWVQTYLDNYVINAILINNDTIICGSSEGIYKIFNDGNYGWLSNSGLTDRKVLCLSMLGDKFYAGTASGKVFISSDNGISWNNSGTGLPETKILSLYAYSDEFLFAGTYGYGIYRSTDRGLNWNQANAGVQANSITALSSFNNIILAGTEGLFGSVVFYSTNLGVEWHNGIGESGGGITTSFVTKGNSIFAGNTFGLLRSDDSAKTWFHTCYECNDDYILTLDIIGNKIIAGTPKECLISSNDGINWTRSKSGLMNIFVNCMDVCQNKIYAGTNNGLYKSSNYGGNWSAINLFPIDYPIIDIIVMGNIILVSDFSGNFNRSTNYGDTWEQVIPPYILGNNCYFAKGQNNTFYVGAGFGVFSSNNNGNSFIKLSDSWNIPFPDVKAIAVYGNNIYAGTRSEGVFTSTNLGTTWQQTNNGLTDSSITKLALIGNTIFAGTDNHGVFASSDYGLHWSPKTNFLLNTKVNMLYSYNNIIFAGLDNYGVLFSTDNGANWTQKDEGMGQRTVQSFLVANNFAFAGTSGNSVMRRGFSELIHINSQLPILNFYLEQNYPNPFNLATTIQFAITFESNVNISIYDITGRKLEEIINANHRPGYYQVIWKGENYSSGIYYYRMTVGNNFVTKKFCLIK